MFFAGSRVPFPAPVLYLAIPAHNEVATIGVLLWRIRTVLAEFPREYEVIVFDDASSDETAEVAQQYAHAMPVTVLRGTTCVGYAGAVDALIRHVSAQTRYPRRDAMLLLQGDFTDPPGIVPEFARRFEGGADLVVGERMVVADAPAPVRRLFKAAHWAMRFFVRVDGVNDPTASMRLIRISALRDLVRDAGSDAVCAGDSWTANADLLLRLVPLARRVESVPVEPTYGVRMRDTRRVAVRDALAALKWAWGARGRRAVPGSASEPASEADRRPARGGAPAAKRRDETELSVEKLRERVRDRPRVEDEESFNGRREGRRRERERAKSSPPSDEPNETPRERAPERTPDRAPERAIERPSAKASEKESTNKRPPRRARTAPQSPYSDPTLELDDPFAAPSARRDAAANAQVTPDTPTAPRPPAFAGAADPVEDAIGHPEPAGVDAGGDLDDGADDAESDTQAEGENDAPRKKRRRNRRSRRGRSKKDGTTDGAAESAPENADEENADEENADEENTDEGNTDLGADPDEPTSYDGAPNDSRGEGDDSDPDSAARARRRGRRGRRGGARRARGQRDNKGGQAAGPDDEVSGGGSDPS